MNDKEWTAKHSLYLSNGLPVRPLEPALAFPVAPPPFSNFSIPISKFHFFSLLSHYFVRNSQTEQKIINISCFSEIIKKDRWAPASRDEMIGRKQGASYFLPGQLLLRRQVTMSKERKVTLFTLDKLAILRRWPGHEDITVRIMFSKIKNYEFLWIHTKVNRDNFKNLAYFEKYTIKRWEVAKRDETSAGFVSRIIANFT